MKKCKYERYDLDSAYISNEYGNTLTYGNANINIEGIEEQLQNLELEKNRYVEKVDSIINPEREKEKNKYERYDKWEKREKKCKWAEIVFIILFFLEVMCHKYLPIGFRTSMVYGLLQVILYSSVFAVIPLAFIVTKIIKHFYGICYKQYIKPISSRLNDLRTEFTWICNNYYEAIDNLYLLSLDPTHRELVLLRRQQEKHNQEMVRFEIERQRAEKELYKEQRRTREATEGLLSIEREREERYRKW